MNFTYHYNILKPVGEDDAHSITISIPDEMQRYLQDREMEISLPHPMVEEKVVPFLLGTIPNIQLPLKAEYQMDVEICTDVKKMFKNGTYEYQRNADTAYFDDLLLAETARNKEFLLELKRNRGITLLGCYQADLKERYASEFEDSDMSFAESMEYYKDEMAPAKIILDLWTQKYTALGAMKTDKMIYSDIALADAGNIESRYGMGKDDFQKFEGACVLVKSIKGLGDEIDEYVESIEKLSEQTRRLLKENLWMEYVVLEGRVDIESESVSYDLFDVHEITKQLLQSLACFLNIDKKDLDLIEELDISKQTFYKMKNGLYIPKTKQVVFLLQKYMGQYGNVTEESVTDAIFLMELQIKLLDCSHKKRTVLNNLKNANVEQWFQYDILQAKNLNAKSPVPMKPMRDVYLSAESIPETKEKIIVPLDTNKEMGNGYDYEILANLISIKLLDEGLRITHAGGKCYLNAWLCEALGLPYPIYDGFTQYDFGEKGNRMIIVNDIIARIEAMHIATDLKNCIIEAVRQTSEMPWESHFLVYDTLIHNELQKECDRFVKLVGALYMCGDVACLPMVQNNYQVAKKYMEKYRI